MNGVHRVAYWTRLCDRSPAATPRSSIARGGSPWSADAWRTASPIGAADIVPGLRSPRWGSIISFFIPSRGFRPWLWTCAPSGPSIGLVLTTLTVLAVALVANAALAVNLKLATFKLDVTPPIGSPLCDALVPPATGVNDPLSARGIILAPEGQKPVVLVAIDWVGIGNDAHEAWREAIAQACHTTRDRVAVHCLHQHDAPGCDFLAEKYAAEAGLPNEIFPVEYSRKAIKNAAAAAGEAMAHLETVTHVGYGKGIVEKVASNRRILGPDGKVLYTRTTATGDPKIRAYPEGTIDPAMRLVSFWNGERPIAVLSYYATHPQSYYRTGKISADYPAMARDQRETAEGAGLHIHFNGAGGNIGAGKYNDGSHENRPILAGRVADGMKLAWENTQKVAVTDLPFDWATVDLTLPLADWYDQAEAIATLHDTKQEKLPRIKAARALAWAERAKNEHDITVARLRLGPIDILHAPGELFVEYQLAAQKMRPDSFVCMAAYGDYGPGYIGTAEAYTQGGYETGIESKASRVNARAEGILMGAFQKLLQ
jgi:hypothetical protein